LFDAVQLAYFCFYGLYFWCHIQEIVVKSNARILASMLSSNQLCNIFETMKYDGFAFPSKNYMDIWSLLWFHMNFRILLFQWKTPPLWYGLHWIYRSLWVHWYFSNINSYNLKPQNIVSFICVIINFFH
jgi:hypothetical protein